MLLLGSSFENMPVLSLRIGTPVGKVIGHLINPHKLTIDALWCKMGGSKEPQLILVQDVREISLKGLIVNDHEVAVDPSEAIRLKPIIDLAYELLGKKVISGRLSIGKVTDYAVENEQFTIQKLYANPTALARLKTTRLTIDRSQIIEVSPDYVKVNDSRVTSSDSVRTLRQTAQAGLSPSASSASTTSE
jgi:hypothetical protein